MDKEAILKVFLPSAKDVNPFLDEIILKSKTQFYFGDLGAYKIEYPVVLINWPEQLFNWEEPTNEDLDLLKAKFEFWQQKSHIVYVVHNLKRHYGMTPNFKKLYNLVIKYAKSTIHFGEFSKSLFQKMYPYKRHEYIPHPLYKSSFKQFNKQEARKILGIPLNDCVIIAPGIIRNKTEKSMIINAFNGFKEKNKLLLVPKMYFKRFNINFKGRTLLKKVVDIKKIIEFIYNKSYNTKHKFHYGFITFNNLSLMMSAADIVLIPRMEALNSGNVFLGLSYKKIIVGPNVGNIKEFLKYFNMPSFNPNNKKSIVQALNNSKRLHDTKAVFYNEKQLSKFTAKVVAKKWDTFLSSLV